MDLRYPPILFFVALLVVLPLPTAADDDNDEKRYRSFERLERGDGRDHGKERYRDWDRFPQLRALTYELARETDTLVEAVHDECRIRTRMDARIIERVERLGVEATLFQQYVRYAENHDELESQFYRVRKAYRLIPESLIDGRGRYRTARSFRKVEFLIDRIDTELDELERRPDRDERHSSVGEVISSLVREARQLERMAEAAVERGDYRGDKGDARRGAEHFEDIRQDAEKLHRQYHRERERDRDDLLEELEEVEEEYRRSLRYIVYFDYAHHRQLESIARIIGILKKVWTPGYADQFGRYDFRNDRRR